MRGDEEWPLTTPPGYKLENLTVSSLCGIRRIQEKRNALTGEQAPHSVCFFFLVPGSFMKKSTTSMKILNLSLGEFFL